MRILLKIEFVFLMLIIILLLWNTTIDDWYFLVYMIAELGINVLLLKFESAMTRRLFIAAVIIQALSVVVPVIGALYIGAYCFLHSK